MKIIITEEQLKILINESSRMDGSVLSVSSSLLDWLKYHEGSAKSKGEPMLKTYTDSVGVNTIGYGHTGKYAIPGKTITKETADKLLINDVKDASNCVLRFLNVWKENKNPGYKLKQNEFDTLVSLVYNSGCNGVRQSDFIQELKKGDYIGAAEGIKSYKSSGLENRRNAEYEMFKNGKYIKK